MIKIGEIKYGYEIGRKNGSSAKALHIYHSCEDCGKERWVQYINGRPTSSRCVNCANKRVGLIRPITLWPFPNKVIFDAAKKASKVLVVEMSAGQMIEDVKIAVEGQCPVHFYGRPGGGVPTPLEIEREALSSLRG